MAEANLKDLQSILRSQMGANLLVESYVTKDFLLPGENYGSTIVSVDAIIKRSEDAKSENLHLVAKLPLTTQFSREMIDSSYTFRKEIFMYAEILPFYRQLELQNCADEEKLANISPDYYGSRLSMNPAVVFDDDAAILLENLKSRGYYCTDRQHGCDFAHAKLAVNAMARLHGLGMITKEKHPDFFEVLKVRSKGVEIKNIDDWAQLFGQGLKNITDDPAIAEYYAKCVKMFETCDFTNWFAAPAEPWSTIVHSDFWTNNMLYHKNDRGEPDDIKLIDFQNYLFLSPSRELAFFLGVGLNHDTISRIGELIEQYYDTLIGKLKAFNCDVEQYPRHAFCEQLKEDARTEFMHCLCMTKVLTADVSADDLDARNIMSTIQREDCGETFKGRIRDLVTLFHATGWLDE